MRATDRVFKAQTEFAASQQTKIVSWDIHCWAAPSPPMVVAGRRVFAITCSCGAGVPLCSAAAAPRQTSMPQHRTMTSQLGCLSRPPFVRPSRGGSSPVGGTHPNAVNASTGAHLPGGSVVARQKRASDHSADARLSEAFIARRSRAVRSPESKQRPQPRPTTRQNYPLAVREESALLAVKPSQKGFVP